MSDTIAVRVTVDAGHRTGPYQPIWNWFGYDEPNYTYTEHGRMLLGELADLSPAPVRVRTHNLLTSGDGTPALKWGSTNAYTEDADGNPVYAWAIVDRIFDAYVEAGIVPFVQVGFTPEALSDFDGPYRHGFKPDDRYVAITTGWAAPPNDLTKWSALVGAWARHLAERYGQEQVASWPWEVWNEPDGHYWLGSVAEFCAMYDHTVHAIKEALPDVRVGGPHTCGVAEDAKAEAFLRAFLQHCADGRNAVTGGTGSPVDFIAFHAKGEPVVHEGHVRMGIDRHLRHIRDNLKVMSEYPAFNGLTAILGESDPEGCAACSARFVPRNGYRNGPLYGVYTVEAVMRTYELSRRAGIEIEGAVTWAFLFEGQPYFDGFRDLATNGIDKAVLNAFRMLGMLGGDWIRTESSQALPIEDMLEKGVRRDPDVNVVATRDQSGVSVLVWHYHDDDAPGPDARISLSLVGLPGWSLRLSHYRMDRDHSNAHAVWERMGSPQEITEDEYMTLQQAAKLQALEEPRTLDTADGSFDLEVVLPRQGVSLLRIAF